MSSIARYIKNKLQDLNFISDPKHGEFEIQYRGRVFFVNYDAGNREIWIAEYDSYGHFIRDISGDGFLKYLPEPKAYLHEIDFCNLLLTHKI